MHVLNHEILPIMYKCQFHFTDMLKYVLKVSNVILSLEFNYWSMSKDKLWYN